MPGVNSAGNLLKTVVLAIVLLALAAVGFWWLKIHDFSVRLAIDDGVSVLQSAGPVAFFAAMAVLPALGVPISLFYLTAGSAFSAQIGLGGVLVATGVALAVNIALAYGLARAVRPWLEAQISRTKYRIPQLDAADHAELTLIVQISPVPFFIKGYLLGLAGVRFRTYMWVSWVVAMPMSAGMIVFGDAILHGKAKLAFFGVSAIVVVTLVIHFLRRHYGKKRT